ncbi:MAG: DNA repair protein RecO [Pyrinomonadaceae bacterium]
MPLVETESLVIKSYNLAEADRIVVLLTREHGMIRGVAKGAKRLKSKFGSGLEPFSVVKVEYFEKETTELVNLQKVDIVTSNFTAASDPEFLQKFSYLGDILITFSPPHDPNETLYRMVKACVETAARDLASIQSIGVYFELWLLRLSGFLPDWSKCDNCGRPFADGEDASLHTDMHLRCVDCRRSHSGRTLIAEAREAAISARRLSPAEFAALTQDKQESLRYLSTLMKQLISQATGREVTGETSLAISI